MVGEMLVAKVHISGTVSEIKYSCNKTVGYNNVLVTGIRL